MKKRIYIAGPMTGIAYYNYPAFDDAANILRLGGFHVLNPTEIATAFGTVEEINADHRLIDAVIEAELLAVKSADAILLLPGWRGSVGARRELAEAIKNDLEIFTDIAEIIWK